MLFNQFSHSWNSLSNRLRWLVLTVLALKAALIFVLPVTGDEAYFIQWGQTPALGYYDHPPAVGWTIGLLSLLNDSVYFYRSIAYLSSIIIAVFLFRLLVELEQKQSAHWVALAYLVSPISLFSVLLANDVVLTFFGFLGFYYYHHATQHRSTGLAIFAGILLALAFLSKYLSAMFFIGIFCYSLVNFKRVCWKVAMIVALIVLLAIGENIWFNLNNCWNNILFNLVARTQDDGFQIKTILLFLLTLIILFSPWAAVALARNWKNYQFQVIRQSQYVVVTFLLVFGLVSLKKTVGLHWFALMMPFAFMLTFSLATSQLRGLLVYSATISLVIGTILSSTVLFADSFFDLKQKRRDVAFYLRTSEVCDLLPQNSTIFTDSYSSQSVLSYHCASQQFHVAFDTSKYGREDDKRVNFSQWDGKTLWIFDISDDIVDKVSDYFDRVETESMVLENGSSFVLVKGMGFKYPLYRENILKPICAQYYSIPEWLPVGQCKFKEKYQL